jgi:hypothetical protein
MVEIDCPGKGQKWGRCFGCAEKTHHIEGYCEGLDGREGTPFS